MDVFFIIEHPLLRGSFFFSLRGQLQRRKKMKCCEKLVSMFFLANNKPVFVSYICLTSRHAIILKKAVVLDYTDNNNGDTSGMEPQMVRMESKLSVFVFKCVHRHARR